MNPQRIGPYRLIRELGSGGMGRVFLGRSAGGRPVAVKVIRADLGADPEFRERFRREVAAAQKVNGLYTALVVDADLDGPTPWLATAYVAGPSLADAVGRHGPLPVTAVSVLAAGLAEGLAAIHAAGLVHRDLKPSNVLLADDGPRVIDFGISRAIEASVLTRTGLVIGSPGFMSPEQAEGREVGTPSDVFSLGAVLTFAATGQGPFGTGPTAALVYRIVHARPALDGIPAQLRPLIERCLAKDPRRRPTTADVLAEVGDPDLGEGWLPAAVIDIYPRPADPGPEHWSRNHRPTASRDYPDTVATAGEDGGRAGPVTSGSAASGPGKPVDGERVIPRLPRNRILALAAGACAIVAAVVVVIAASSPGSPPKAQIAQTARADTLTNPGGQAVTGLAFMPDGKDLAAGDSNGVTYLWTVATRKVDDTIKGLGSASSVAASPDGRFLSIGSDSGAAYQATRADGHFATRKLPRSSQFGYIPPVVSTTFSADSSTLAAGYAGGGFYLWRTSTGRVARILAVETADGSSTSAFSPDGLTLAGTGANSDIDLWTVSTGKLAKILNTQARGSAASLAFSPDGTTLIDTGNNGHIYLWSTATGKVTRTFTDPGAVGAAAGALSRDGKMLAVADDNGHIYVWSMASGKVIETMAYQLPVNGTAALAFSPDGRMLAAGGDHGKIYLWTIR